MLWKQKIRIPKWIRPFLSKGVHQGDGCFFIPSPQLTDCYTIKYSNGLGRVRVTLVTFTKKRKKNKWHMFTKDGLPTPTPYIVKIIWGQSKQVLKKSQSSYKGVNYEKEA